MDAEKNAKKRGGKGKSTVNGQHQRLDESKLLSLCAIGKQQKGVKSMIVNLLGAEDT